MYIEVVKHGTKQILALNKVTDLCKDIRCVRIIVTMRFNFFFQIKFQLHTSLIYKLVGVFVNLSKQVFSPWYKLLQVQNKINGLVLAIQKSEKN